MNSFGSPGFGGFPMKPVLDTSNWLSFTYANPNGPKSSEECCCAGPAVPSQRTANVSSTPFG